MDRLHRVVIRAVAAALLLVALTGGVAAAGTLKPGALTPIDPGYPQALQLATPVDPGYPQ